MRTTTTRLSVLILLLAAACSSKVPRDNPYDPDAPPSVQIKAKLLGAVVLEAASSYGGVSVVARDVLGGESALSYGTTTEDDGGYVVEVPAGTYNVLISQQGYVDVSINNVAVLPGDERDLGTSSLDIARGSLQGTVVLDDGASPAGTSVSIVPLDIPNGRTTTVLAGADGTYFADGLAAGHYLARAERDSYAPAYTEGGVEVQLQQISTAPDLRLYPAAAIVKIELAGDVAHFVNTRTVDAVLLPFVQFLTDMMVSEDPEFADPAWDTDWRTFNTPVAFDLSDADGEHVVYAKFRDSLGFESKAFSGTVILDREPPEIQELAINGGDAFLTVLDGVGEASVRFTAFDGLSGVELYRWTTAPSFTTEPELSAGAVDTVITHYFDAPLGDDNGMKTLQLLVYDRAGNASPAAAESIFRDREPPVATPPVIAIDPAELSPGGAVRSLDVTLLFDVAGDRPGEKLYMATSNTSGLDASAFFVPFQSPAAHKLAAGPDSLAREACAIFRDEAGHATQEYCIPVDVDRTGAVTGFVALEGETDHSNVLVELAHPLDVTTVYTDFTDATGAYTVIGVPAATGYGMRFSRTGFVDEVDLDVTVIAGATSDRGTTTLSIPRAGVTGVVTYVGAGNGQNAGIVISDATSTYTAVTGPNGNFTIGGLPVNLTYQFSARAPGYNTLNFNLVDNLADGEMRNLGSFILQEEQGDFRVCDGSDDADCSGGAIQFTSNLTVVLDLDEPTLTFWRVSLDSTFSGGADPFVPFNNADRHTFTFSGTEPDGQKTIWVQYDDDGLAPLDELPISGNVTLDTTPPVPATTGPVVVNADGTGTGATYSNHPTGAVTVSLSASDTYAGVASVRLLNGPVPPGVPDFTGIPAVGYFSTVSHTLDIVTQGEKYVYVQFCDAVDNCTAPAVSPYDDIIYDTLPPNAATGVDLLVYDGDNDPLVDLDGDTVTDSPFVVVKMETGDAIALRFGNTESLSGIDWIGVDPGDTLVFQHILPLGEGAHTVFAQFQDPAGNSSPTSPVNPHAFAIDLDTVPPTSTSVTIAEGSFTNQDGVTLDMVAFEAVETILHVGDVEDFSGETWQAFTGSAPAWTMSTPAGFPVPITDKLYNIYVRFRDAAGNETATLMRSVTRDTVAPEFGSVEVLEGEYASTQQVNLILFAVGASDMTVTIVDLGADLVDPGDDVVVSQTTQPYSPATVADLGATPGTYAVQVEYADLAGNVSAPVEDRVTFDGTEPQDVTFDIQESPFTNDASVVLDIFANGASTMMISNNGSFTGAAWEPYATSRAWDLEPVEGLKTVRIKLRDEAGNETVTFTAQTTLDTSPPDSLSVTIVGLAANPDYIDSSTVDVQVAASDTNGVAVMMLANDAAFSGGAWESFASPRTGWSLTAGDGPKTVFVRFRDVAGNVSESADAITVDTVTPAGSVTLAAGAVAVSTYAGVPVSLSASADVPLMLLVEGLGVDCTLQTIDVPFDANATFTFAGTPSDGPLELTACFEDNAGHLASAEDTVLLDRVPPVATLAINGGTGGYTNNPVVTLSITATDATSGVDAMRIANQQDMTGIAWEGFSATRTWTVDAPAADGLKTVWLEVRDRGDQVADNISATVTLDTAAPSGSIAVDQGAFTQSPDITTSVTRGDTGTIQMAISQGFLDCGGATYAAFDAGPNAMTLTGGDGLKTVYLCLRDQAGNTAGYSTTVYLDTLDPTGVVQIDGGDAYATSRNVTLNITTDPDVVEMKVANGGTIDCAADAGYESINLARAWVLADSDGLRTVSVCLRDGSERYVELADTITLDRAPPAPAAVGGDTGIQIDGGNARTNSTLVALGLAAADTTSGVTEMKLSDGATCSGGVWQQYAPTALWTIEAGDDVLRTVSVAFRDAAGLTSVCASDDITIDTVDPAVTVFQIDGGGLDTEYTADDQVIITNLTYVGNCLEIQVSEDQTFASGVQTYPCGTTWPTDNSDANPDNDHYVLQDYAADGSLDGLKYIYARIVDAASNASDAVVDTVILDTGGPTEGAVIINDGDAFTDDLLLTVQYIAQGATEMKVADNETCAGGSWEPIQSLDTIAHSGPDANDLLWVSVEFRDDAGNGEGVCYNDSIEYDSAWVGGGSVTIVALQGTPPYTTSTEVELTLTPGETTNVEMKISNGAACVGGTWEPFVDGGSGSMTKSWTLASAGEGQRDVSVRYRDAAGNLSSCYTDQIDIDTVPPSGLSLVIDGGAEYTTDATPAVTLTISAAGMADVRISEDPTFGGGETFQSTGGANPFEPAFTLTAANGTKTVYVVFRDAAGNVASSLASDSIILDNVPPTGTLFVEADAVYTRHAGGLVTLNVTASDNHTGVATMEFRTGDAVPAWGAWLGAVPYQPTYSNLQLALPVASQNDVTRWVQVRFADRAGNVSVTTIQDDIQLDNVAPALGAPAIEIAGGASVTPSQQVDLALDASNGVATMQISNGQSCTGGGAWQTYAASVTGWSLDSGGDGVLKYVSARFRDAAGNETSCAYDSIDIDTVAPVAQFVTIEGGDDYSASNTLSLTVSYTGTPTIMRIANSEAGLAGAAARTPAVAATYDATSDPEGLLTLYVRFEDAAGNISNTVLDSIVRDRSAPTGGTVFINNNATYTTSGPAVVNLSLSALDAFSEVAQMDIRNAGDTSWTTVDFATAHNGWTLGTAYPPGENEVTKTVEVRFRDAVGNTSGVVTDSIILDNVAPVASSVSIDAGNATTTSTRVALTISASGNPATMRVSNTNNCTGGATYVYDSSIVWTLDTSGDGVVADVSVQVFDAAGNASNCVNDSITVDTVRPVLSSITLDGRFNSAGTQIGSDPNDTRDCYLRIADASVSGSYTALQFSLSYTFSTVFQTVPAGTSWPYNLLLIPAGSCFNGLKYVYARAVDAAGNASSYISTPMRVDTLGPSGLSGVIENGATYTDTLDWVVRLGAPYDAGGIETVYLSHTSIGVCGGGTEYDFQGKYSEYDYTYGGAAADGTKWVYLCLVDGAGNGTWLGIDSIYYDTTAPTSIAIRVDNPTGGSDFIGGTATAGDLVCAGGSPADAHWVSEPGIKALLAASDASGVSEMKIAEDDTLNGFTDSDFDAVSWQRYYTSAPFTLSSGDGPKMLSMRARDVLGAWAEAATPVCVTLDTTPPENVEISVDAGGACNADATLCNNYQIDVTLLGEDHQSSSAGMQMCFGRGSALQTNGIRRGSDGSLIGSESGSTTCSYSTNWYPFESDLRLWVTNTSGTKPIVVFLRDAAGNKSAATDTSVYLDISAPADPVLNVVETGNESAHLYWTASSDPETGVESYELWYRELQPTAGSWTLAGSADGGAVDAVVTGLTNRTRYEFRIRAINGAGATSAYSNAEEGTVGWRRTSVAFSATHSLVPFGVVEYDGTIYVAYVQYEVLWGEINSTLHVAISHDGGDSWQLTTVDDVLTPGRQDGGLYAGPGGVVIGAVHDADPTAGPFNQDLDLVAWRSTDRGATWTMSTVDTNGTYIPHSVAMASRGGAIVMFQQYTNDEVHTSWSTDGGQTWSAPAMTYDPGVAIESMEACNVQFNTPWVYRDGDTLYLMRSYTLGYISYLSTSRANVMHAAVSCSDPHSISPYHGRAYAVFTATDTDGLYLRAYNDPAASWSTTDITLRASGAANVIRPAIYAGGVAGGERVFVAYRDTAGDLWVGTSNDPDNASTYTWVEADKAGNVGVNMVINGTASNSPILAYTDESAHQLYVLRSALPAPNVRGLAGLDEVSLGWADVPNASAYEVEGGAGNVVTPETAYYESGSAIGPYSFAVRSVDEYQQVGPDGYTWDLGSFVRDWTDYTSVAIGTMSSSTGAVEVSGTDVFTVSPIGYSDVYGGCASAYDICLFYSADSGLTWSGIEARNMTVAPVAQHMAIGSNGASVQRVHVIYTDDETYPDLEYRYADGPAFTTWSTAVDLDQLDSASDGVIGRGAQISTSNSWVLAVWSQTDSATTRNIRYAWSSDYGVTWDTINYLNATNTDVELGYSAYDLTIGDHYLDDAWILWTTGGQIRAAYDTSISGATPTWTFTTISGGNNSASFVRAARYRYDTTVAWIGRQDDTVEVDDTVNLFVGGRYAMTDNNVRWALLRLDNEKAIADSLDVWMGADGTYVVYGTERTLFGRVTRQLKLAYCVRECTGRDNWHISVLSTDADTIVQDYRGAHVDLSGSDIFIGASCAPATSANSCYESNSYERYMMFLQGRMRRLR